MFLSKGSLSPPNHPRSGSSDRLFAQTLNSIWQILCKFLTASIVVLVGFLECSSAVLLCFAIVLVITTVSFPSLFCLVEMTRQRRLGVQSRQRRKGRFT